MPSAGLVIGAGSWLAGSNGHGFTLERTLGGPRLSHATIALTRGSFCPTKETPPAPNECPASPIFFGFRSCQSGLCAAFNPEATRRLCLAAWLVPLSQLGRGL